MGYKCIPNRHLEAGLSKAGSQAQAPAPRHMSTLFNAAFTRPKIAQKRGCKAKQRGRQKTCLTCQRKTEKETQM